MSRPSIWTARRRAPVPHLQDPLTVDVAVVGAGITGLTAAVKLARAGCRVAVLENRRLGSGATGFTTAKISLLQGTRYRRLQADHGAERTQAYVDANADAAEWIERRVQGDGIDCGFQHRTALTWVHEAGALPHLEEEAQAAQAAGLDARLVTETDLPFPVAGGVELSHQAQFHPLAYLNGLANLATTAGALLFEETRVTGLDRDGADGPVSVHTPDATVSADHVLVCTGIPFVDRGLFFARLEPVRSYAIAVPRPPLAPESMSISDDEPVRSLRTAVAEDGEELLLVGGAGHGVGRRADTDGAHRELAEWSRAVLGVEEVRAGWSTQDYVPQDGMPYVGTTWSLPDRVRVATGFAKWGMTNGTAAGRLLAAEVLGEPPAWAEVFAAGRLGPAHTVRKLVDLNAKVGGLLVKDKFVRHRRRPEPAEGEGHVVREGVHLTAVSRTDGVICAVTGTCAHLGGTVAWNPVERSWDCPLHGSRFDADGTLLQGPSVRDLAPRPPGR